MGPKALCVALSIVAAGCDGGSGTPASPPKSASGVKQTSVDVSVSASGLTVEQENVGDRLMQDNTAGSIKHLYVISPFSGDVLIYSTVKGKVTSSGKRLTPTTVAAIDGEFVDLDLMGVPVVIGGRYHRTSEVLQDDGTYGNSIDYLFWWDVHGRYHQHYISGGAIVHVSDQPLPVGRVIINLENR